MEMNWKEAYWNALLANLAYVGGSRDQWEDVDVLKRKLEDHGFSDRTVTWFLNTYEFVDASLDNTLSGYDGILLRKRAPAADGGTEYVLLNRGTEVDVTHEDVTVADVMADLLADYVAISQGESVGQLEDLNQFYLRNEGLLTDPGAHLTVVGHSLGGHLSTLFALKNAQRVDSVWTYNTLGVPEEVLDFNALTPGEQLAFESATREVLDTMQKVGAYSAQFARHATTVIGALYHSIVTDVSAPDGVQMWNFLLEDGADLANEIFARHGTSVYAEGGETGDGSDVAAVHSIAKLADTLLMTWMMTAIDPSLSEQSIGRLVRMMSADTRLDHDHLVEAAARYFLLPFRATEDPREAIRDGGNTYNPAYHDDLEQTAIDIAESATAAGGFTLAVLPDLDDAFILAKLRQDDAVGHVFRYAVIHELPFVILGNARFEDAIANDPRYDALAHSDAEWKSRLVSLRGLFEVHTDESGFAPMDRALNYLNAETGTWYRSEDGTGQNARHAAPLVDIRFGTEADDVIGGILAEAGDGRFFGGDGADEISGQLGNDHLEGGRGDDRLDGRDGDDTLVGNAGNDILVGNLGNDRLHGGEGADLYRFSRGDGRDVVDDPSASTRIEIDGVALGSIRQLQAGLPVYEDGVHRYQVSGDDLLVLVDGASSPDRQQSIRLLDWDPVFNHYGLQVIGAPTEAARQPDGREMQVGSGEEGYTAPDGVSSVDHVHTHQVEREAWLNGVSLHYEADHYQAYDPNTFSFSQPFVFEGGHVEDFLYAGAHRDHLYGGDGDDVLHFYNGENVGEGGRGSDVLYGGAGADTLWGASSGYHLRGGVAEIEEQPGDRDLIDGGDGDDWISGGSWRDTLRGGPGNDFIDGGAGADWIAGGDGDDQVLGDSRVELRDGEQVLYRYHRYATAATEGLYFHDWIEGGAGDDLLLGELGDDVVLGGDGADLLVGDRLNDSSFYADDPGNPADDYRELPVELHGDDELRGGNGDDQLYGNAGNDVLYGEAGADRLHGDDPWLPAEAQGDDRLFGGIGNDQLEGGAGRDVLHGEEGDDVALGGAGDDWVYGGDGNDLLHGDDAPLAASLHGRDVLFGGSGMDQLQGGGGADRLHGGEDADRLFGEAGDDILHGDGGADDLVGGDGNDWLDGGDGNDRLWGGAGADVLRGGPGHDLLLGEAGDDTYLYRAGDGRVEIDDTSGLQRIRFLGLLSEEELTVSQVAGYTELRFGQTGDVIRMQDSTWRQVASIELPDGREYLPVLVAPGTEPLLTGSAGADLLQLGETQFAVAGAGDDLVVGGASAQFLYGGGGSDLLFGRGGADELRGEAGDDLLHGDQGADQLLGGEGNDELAGGPGNDFLHGGAGNDLYVYRAGDGYDELEGHDLSGWDVLAFGPGILPSDVQLREAGGSLRVLLGSQDTGLWSAATAESGVLDEIRFQDDPGTVWTVDDFATLYHRASAQDDIIWAVPGLEPVIEGLDGNDLLIGAGGDEILRGGAGADLLEGAAGNDWLLGGSGDDDLMGGPGDDVLEGDAGADRLRGFEGADLYRFSPGFGHDVVETDDDVTGADVYRFEKDLASTQGWVSGGEHGQLLVGFGDGADRLELRGYLSQRNLYAGDRYEFADGVIWSDADLWSHYLQGSAQDDHIYGSEDAEELAGRAGDDTLQGGGGDDWLHGGAGRDLLYGDAGADTFAFSRGDGNDLLYPGRHESLEIQDRVLFLSGIAPEEVEARRLPDSDLRLRIRGTGDWIDVHNYFTHSVQSHLQVQFLDDPGVNWTFAEIDAMKFAGSGHADEIFGDAAGQVLEGLAGDDRLHGGAGDDTLQGGNGNDWLDGQWGADTLDGGAGSDVYYYRAGDGDDVIRNFDASTDRTDVLQFADDIGTRDVRVYRDFQDLRLDVRGATLTVAQWFDGPDHQLDALRFADGTEWQRDMLGRLAATATDGRDHLVGTAGDDVLAGLAGDDLLQGGPGMDHLRGDAGADTYLYHPGDGDDVIENFDGSGLESEAVRFGAGVDADQVTARRSGDDLLLYLSLEGSLRVLGHFSDPARSITGVRFEDGSTWSAEEIAARVLLPTDGDDELIGGQGRDELHGAAGDDLLDGAGGYDLLWGDAGNDTYRFGRGSDMDVVINQDKTADRFDRIRLDDDVQVQEVTIQRDRDDLYLLLRESGDSLVVTNHFALKGQAARSYIDAVEFADGTTWDRDAIRAFTERSVLGNYVLAGDAQANLLQGLGGDDLLTGLGGDDRLQGGAGSDELAGGTGNDWMQGGTGNDLYRFERGGGADTIDNFDTGTGRQDIVELGAGIEPGELGILRLGEDLWINAGGGDSLLVQNFYLPGHAIDAVRFEDGTYWSEADLRLRAEINHAPVVNGEVREMEEDGVLVLQVSDLLANDHDPEGDPLRFAGVQSVSHGVIDYTAEGGELVFRPAADFFGTAGIRYAVSDGLQSTEGTVQIEVQDMPEPPNHAPVAGDDALDTEADVVLRIAAATLLANDHDVDDQSLQLVAVGNAVHAGVEMDPVTGEVVVTPDPYFVGEAQFDYRVSDGEASAMGTVRLTVSPGMAATVGTSGNDTLVGGRNADVLHGAGGEDLLEGGRGADELYGGAGNDLLRGGEGDDVYIVQAGQGADIIEGAGRKTGQDSVWLTGDTDAWRVWLQREGSDLKFTMLGAGGSVTVRDWYVDARGQLHEIHADGQTLTNAKVDSLVEAMSGYPMPTGPDAEVPEVLRPAVESAWV